MSVSPLFRSLLLSSVSLFCVNVGYAEDVVVGQDNANSTQSGVNGPVSLVKTGTGTVTLQGTNTYSGNTTVNNGTLAIDVGEGNITTNSASITSYTNDHPKLLINSGAFQSFGNVALGIATGSAGTVVVNGAGSSLLTQGLIVVGNGDPNYGTGSNPDTSVLTLNDGAQANALGVVVGNYSTNSGIVNVIGQGSTLTTQNYNLYVNGDGNGTVNVSNGGEIFNNGQVILGSGSGLGSAHLNIGPNGTLVVGDLSSDKPGIVSNLKPSSYQVTVDNGTIENYQDPSSGQGVSLHTDVNMTLNGTLHANTLDQSTEFSGVLSGNGGVDKQGSGALTLSGNNTFAGGVTVQDGSLILQGNNAYSGDSVVQHGTLQVGAGSNTGSIGSSSSVQLQGSDATLNVDRSDSNTFTARISGDGSVVQSGTGETRLTNNNSYQGTTTVNSGTLIVNGDQSAATGTTIVNNGGKLSGNGTIGGDVSLGNGSSFSPGEVGSVGALTIKGNLNADSGSSQTWNIGKSAQGTPGANDLVNVQKNLTLAGSVDINVDRQGGALKKDGSLQDGIYRIYNYGGSRIEDSSFHIGSVEGADPHSFAIQTAVDKQVNLVTNAQHLSFWDAIHGGSNGSSGKSGVIYGGDGIWAAQNIDRTETLPSGDADSSSNNWTDVNATSHGRWTSGNTAIFQGHAGSVTVFSSQDAPITIDGMQFANSDGKMYVIGNDQSKDPLYATSDETNIRVGDGSNNGDVKALVNSVIDDSHVEGGTGLNKLDSGTLILGGDNFYKGKTTISGGTLQLGNGSSGGMVGPGEIVNNAHLSTNHSDNIYLGQNISGTGDFSQIGSGETELRGQNTYTGVTNINAGTLMIGNNGTISNSAGVRLNQDNAKFDISRLTGESTSVRSLDGQGQVNLGDKNLNITDGNRTIRVVYNDQGQTVDITDKNYSTSNQDNIVYINKNGAVISAHDYNPSNGDKKFDLNKDGTVINNNQYNGVITGKGGVNITGGVETFGGNNTYQGTTSVSSGAKFFLPGSLQGGVHNEGTVDVNGGTVAGQTVNDGNGVLTAEKASLADVVNNSGKLYLTDKTQASSLTSNAYTMLDGASVSGNFAANNGTFQVSKNDATVGSLTGGAQAQLDGRLTINNADNTTYAGAMAGSGGVTVNSGFQTMTGDSTYDGKTIINKGATLQYGDGGTTGRITSKNVIGDPQIQNDGQLIINHSDVVKSALGITGSGDLTQLGSGTTVLSGKNNYTGGTTVTRGTLQVDGDQSGAKGDTVVQSDANLAGNGIIGGNLFVQKDGKISPGDAPGSIGAFTVNGNLVEENGSQQKWDIGEASTAGGAFNDFVNVKGDLTIGGTLTVNANPEGPSVHGGVLDPGVYRFYSYNGELIDNGVRPDQGNLKIPEGYKGDYLQLQTSIPKQVNLVADGKNLNFWDGGDPAHHGTDLAKGNSKVDGGDGDWTASPSGNWTASNGQGNVRWNNEGRAIFGAETGVVTVKNHDSDGNFVPVRTIGMQVLSGDSNKHYKITGDDLYAASDDTTIRIGDGTSTGANIVAELNSAINDSDVEGGTKLTKTDLGTLILSSDNNYRGATTIANGTLQLGNGGETGSVGPANITNNGRLAIDRSKDLTLGQKISGTGSLTQQGSGTTTLTNQNTYSGATTITNGGLALSGNGSISSSAGVLTSGSGVFDPSGISGAGTSVTTLGGQGQVHLGDKNLALTNANRTVRVTIDDKDIDFVDNQYTGPNGHHMVYVDEKGQAISSSQYNPSNGDRAIDLSKDGTVVVDNQYGGVISGRGGLSVNNGIETLSGQNTYTGTTSVAAGAGLSLPGGSLQGGLHNAGIVDVNGGAVAGQTVNDNPNATITAENGARLGDIANNSGRVALMGAFARNVTNASGATFDAASGQLSSLNNSGTASLTMGNIVEGNVTNNGTLTMDGNGVEGTLLSNGGSFTVTQNNAAIGSLAGGADGTLNGQLTIASAHDTYAGKLSGTPGVRIAGGKEVFSGDNAYTGDTGIDKGAVLQLGSGGSTGSVASTRIRDDGTLEVNRNNDVTLSQAIYGSGNVVQSGTGRTTITSSNAYTGATAVMHGTLALAEGGSVLRSSGVHVNNDGVFDISAIKPQPPATSDGHSGVQIPNNTPAAQTGNDGKTAQVQSLDGNGNVALGSKNLQIVNGNSQFGNLHSGVISGDGNVTVSGGKEIFAGNNTYNGATTIDRGAQLVLGANSASGSVQSNAINVDGNLTVSRNNLATFAQNITGSGSLTQDGDGTTALTGQSTYTGPTTVNRGALDVDGSLARSDVQVNAGTLLGSGMVKSATLEKGTTLAPAGDGRLGSINVGTGQNDALVMKGGSLLSVDADSITPTSPPVLTGVPTITSQGKTYQLLASDQVRVTGSAQLGNDAKVSLPQGNTIKPGLAYTIVTTTNGVNGNFGGVSGLDNLSAFVAPRLVASDDRKDLNLLLDRNNLTFEEVGETRNQRAAGAGLDHAPEKTAVVQAMLSLNRDDARRAENSLSGEVHASARTVLIQDSYYVRQAALDRLDSADCDGSSGHGIGTADLRTGQKSSKCLSDRPVLWGESYGSLGNNSGDGNASSLHHSTAGFVMGADAPIVAQWRVGGLVSYGHSTFNQKNGGNGSGHSDNVTIGGYAGRNFGNLSFKMGASYTWNILSTRRTANVGRNYSSPLTSGYLGGTAQGFGELGYKIHANQTIIEPFANVAYVNQHTNSYREHGGDAALRGRSMNTGITFSTFGVRASSSFMLGRTQIVPHVMAAYRHAFGLTTPTTHELFASAKSGNMDVAGVPLSKDSAVVDAGVSARLTDRINIDVSYIGQYGNQSIDSGARGDVKFQF